MKTIVLDASLEDLQLLEDLSIDMAELELMGRFQRVDQMVRFAERRRFDLAIVEASLPPETLNTLLAQLVSSQPALQVVLSHGAPCVLPQGTLSLEKPYTKESLDALFTQLRGQSLPKPVQIRTFGYFDVFYHQHPLCFSTAKSKELLALLVDRRGGLLTHREACSLLWPNRPFSPDAEETPLLTAQHLETPLVQEHVGLWVQRNSQGFYLPPEVLYCDVLHSLGGNSNTIRQFFGEYM